MLNYLKGLPIAEIVKFSAKIQNFILTSIPLESLVEKVKNAQWSDITKLNTYVQINLFEKMRDLPEGKEIFNNSDCDEPKECGPMDPREEETDSKPSIKSRINESISKSNGLNQNEPNIQNPDLDCLIS